MQKSDFSWLDDDVSTPILPTAPIMQEDANQGKDRIWFCDGDHIWFRRNKANAATLERHNRFTKAGDYEYLGTNDDVEVYKLKEQSIFKPRATKAINLNELDLYNVKRLAAKAAVRRDWPQFADIAAYIRDLFNQQVGDHTPNRWTQNFADTMHAECYIDLVNMVVKRHGPSPGEINRELMALMARQRKNVARVVTV